jgi:class 3 adenylate cyclase
MSLDQFVPEELLHKLEAARASGGMVGERRTVTMLFCDVKGSTSAAEQMDPEEWTEIINGAFERMIRPVYKYEGTLARLMGDAILAFFGAPIAHEDDPQRAVLAGLDIVTGMAPYREEIERRHGIDFDVRVGINTGRVVVGAVGSDLRLEYSAMGDAVNLAARMEQTATPGTVQIAADTYRLVKPLFDFEPLGPIKVKGKAEPVLTYRVMGRKAAPGRLRGIEGLGGELIGREAEWSQLTGAAGALKKGVGQIVFLTGEAGLGKSRLISELHTWLDGERPTGASATPGRERLPDPAWFEVSAVSYETAQPYSLIQRLFRQILAAGESDSPEQTRQRVDSLAAQLPEDERAALVGVAKSLLGLQAAGGGSPLQGEGFKGQLYVVTAALVRRLASRRPLLLVCDDLHWCDPASAALLAHLFPLTGELPLILLFASRPDRDTPGWGLRKSAGDSQALRYTEIVVRPLTAGESSKLVDSLLTISDLPRQLRARILDKSDGNPFFVEEVVRSLIESGSVIQSEDGLHWRAGDAEAAIDIPGNLLALLTARMDRLEDEVRRVLQLAAIVGRSFAYRILERVAGDGEGPESELEWKLNTLQHADLIREAARLPELEYAFRHSLTQEAAYLTILRRQRQSYHQRVGETIEALYPERLAENAAAWPITSIRPGTRFVCFAMLLWPETRPSVSSLTPRPSITTIAPWWSPPMREPVQSRSSGCTSGAAAHLNWISVTPKRMKLTAS